MESSVRPNEELEIVINRAFPIVQEIPAPTDLIAKAISVLSAFDSNNLGCEESLFQMASLSIKPLTISILIDGRRGVISSGSMRAYMDAIKLFVVHRHTLAHIEKGENLTPETLRAAMKRKKQWDFRKTKVEEFDFVKYIHIGGKTHFNFMTDERYKEFSHMQITLALYNSSCTTDICNANLFIIPCKREKSDNNCRTHASGIPFMHTFSNTSTNGRLTFTEIAPKSWFL